MFFLHHPLLTVAVLYLALVAVVVQLDAGVILVAIVALFAPLFTFWLAKRQREQIRVEAAVAAEAAVEAARVATVASDEVRSRVEEVHVLVNSQKDDLERALAERDARITLLEQLLAAGPRPVEDG